jgi:hypothetical protein
MIPIFSDKILKKASFKLKVGRLSFFTEIYDSKFMIPILWKITTYQIGLIYWKWLENVETINTESWASDDPERGQVGVISPLPHTHVVLGAFEKNNCFFKKNLSFICPLPENFAVQRKIKSADAHIHHIIKFKFT